MTFGAWKLIKAFEVMVMQSDGEIRPIATWPTYTEATEHALHLTSEFRPDHDVVSAAVFDAHAEVWDARVCQGGAA